MRNKEAVEKLVDRMVLDAMEVKVRKYAYLKDDMQNTVILNTIEPFEAFDPLFEGETDE